MSENLKLWDSVCKTDPSHTKSFVRAGGFRGTAIKPMWLVKMATEKFGPMGSGWGIKVEDTHVQAVDGTMDVLVFVAVNVWYINPDEKKKIITESMKFWTGASWGGDYICKSTKNGPKTDDEAFKKATTDGMVKALSWLGFGADVHMGLFDDSKYVNSLEQEFAQEELKESDIIETVTQALSTCYTKENLSEIEDELQGYYKRASPIEKKHILEMVSKTKERIKAS